MKDLIGKKVLATTNEWFIAPDGKQYKAVFGTLRSINDAKEAFGFVPSRGHASWFIQIGNVHIAGCQLLYCVEANEANVQFGNVEEWNTKDGVLFQYNKPTSIYKSI